MSYGVFTSVYANHDWKKAAKRAHNAGFTSVQFVPVIGGKWLGASEFSIEQAQEVRAAYAAEGIEILAVSAGHSFVVPDAQKRAQALSDAKRWIELAPAFGAQLVVTEIGSTHPTHNWTDHSDNHTEETWQTVVSIYRELAAHAAKFGVTVGVEMHFAAVIQSAELVRRILDDVGEENLKVVYDPANLVTPENADRQESQIDEFLRLLGKDIVLAHAKDTRIEKEHSIFGPAGGGVLPYSYYIKKLRESGYRGPLVLEYLKEEDVLQALAFLEKQQVPPFLLPLYDGDRQLYSNAKDLLDIVHAPQGALEPRYRLLISMVADALKLHPAGAVACAREAIAAGATKEQVKEALWVVLAAGGLPALIENFDVYREVILP